MATHHKARPATVPSTHTSSPPLFLIDATMFGLPIDVLHDLVGGSARMRVKAGSLVPIVNTTGPEMDQGETVILFNDLCVLAPAALVDTPISWQPIDDLHVRGTSRRTTDGCSAGSMPRRRTSSLTSSSTTAIASTTRRPSWCPQRDRIHPWPARLYPRTSLWTEHPKPQRHQGHSGLHRR